MKDAVRHETRADLFKDILAPFQLSSRDRFIARALVRLVRLKPVIGLLARWHAARSRKI